MRVLTVFGTRPEAIKMCPLIKELEKTDSVESYVCLTGQHREMLQQVIDVFNIHVDYSLDIMRPDQTLFTITADILKGIEAPLQELRPDVVLVHGDTTSSLAAALSAFYLQIPVGHVEAGLRTNDRYRPFPEEMNRVLTGRIASLHFAPTKLNMDNLINEGVKQNVFLTGNTVIDAFRTTLRDDYVFRSEGLASLDFNSRRVILLTAHRRENFGQPLENIFRAVCRLHDEFPDVQFVYPVHPNPNVRQPAQHMLGGLSRVLLTAPLDVTEMHNLMARSYLVLTDSGGLQEEAPYCGIPVLVLRTETERPEAVQAGTVALTGVETNNIYNIAARLLTDTLAYAQMAEAINPYGDGHASERIVKHLLDWHNPGNVET